MPHDNGFSRDCSVEAYKNADRKTQQEKYLDLLRGAGPGGLMDDTVAATGMFHPNSYRAARRALEKRGEVVLVPDPTNEKGYKQGVTSTGCKAGYYALAEYYPDAVDPKYLAAKKLRELDCTYEEYCRGEHFQDLKRRKVEEVGGLYCWMSGLPCPDAQLHHLTYERLGVERLEDVILVSPEWHEVLETIHQREFRRDGSVEKMILRQIERDFVKKSQIAKTHN